MKAKDLKWPFTWEERTPTFSDQVLFVPEYYQGHELWKMPPLFPNDHPIHIEYCSGNGSWILEKAAEELQKNWIAVEYQFERVKKIWAKMRNRNLSNLVIVSGEALTFTRHYLPPASLTRCHINFPDPWPKGRHAKNRLIQAPFALELARVIQPDGSAIFVTDDLNYSRQMLDVMQLSERWEHLPEFSSDGYGSSYFDQLWRSKGRPIHYLHFLRRYP